MYYSHYISLCQNLSLNYDQNCFDMTHTFMHFVCLLQYYVASICNDILHILSESVYTPLNDVLTYSFVMSYFNNVTFRV